MKMGGFSPEEIKEQLKSVAAEYKIGDWALEYIAQLETEAEGLHIALVLIQANWDNGGYFEPLEFWANEWLRINNLLPKEHRSFVWAVERNAALKAEENEST